VNFDDAFDYALEKLYIRRDYLSEWLRNFKSLHDAVPFVQTQLDYTNWMIGALSERPEDATKIQAPKICDQIEIRNQYIQSAFPMIPKIDISLVGSSSGFTASESAAIYYFVEEIGSIDTPTAKKYSKEQIEKYQDLENLYNRQNDVFGLIQKLLGRNSIKRFNHAVKAFNAYKTNLTNRSSTANEIRNLIYGIRGDLYNKARKLEKENMTWEIMAERLAKGGINSVEYKEIINQNEELSKLINILSEILKDREGTMFYNLNIIWIQTLDHIYVILNLIKI